MFLFNLINSLITHHITHTCNLRIIFAKKLFKSIDFAAWIRITWMISLSQCFRRYDLTKNIKNLSEFYEFCNLTLSCLNFKLLVNTLTFCDCIKFFVVALNFLKQCANQIKIFSIIVEFWKMFLFQNQLENH